MSSDETEFVNSQIEEKTESEDFNTDETKTSSTIAKNAANKVKMAQATPSSTNTLQKIAPKPTVVKQTAGGAAVAGSKILYIKSPNGQSLRIGGQLIGTTGQTTSTTTNSNTNAPSSAIQFIKTLDGNFLQIKNKNVVSLPKTTATVTTPSPNNTRFVVKSGPRLILSTPPTTAVATKVTTGVTTTTNPSGSGNTRTLTVSQAQQMGLISSAKLKELVSAANANKANLATTSTNSVTATKPALILPATTQSTSNTIATKSKNNKNPPTILNKGVKPIQSQKILIQSSSNSSGDTGIAVIGDDTIVKPKPITQNVVKVPPNSQLRAVNVAGKGLQYVRVVNAVASSSASNVTVSSANKQTVQTNGGRQHSVFVHRKIIPQQQTTGSLPSNSGSKQLQQQFVTKKLEVTPIASNASRAVSKEAPPAQAKPQTFLLNNMQKSVVNSSIDIKPVVSGGNESFEITSENVEPSSPVNSPQKFTQHTYSLSTERKSKSPEPSYSNLMYSTLKLPSPEPIEGIRRKHCNCTKSQCLKLYCDCFANGEFCSNCNCKECFNTLEKEDERQKAIKICLERNPHAFKPKIGKARDQSDTLRRHTKGCNCKRSGCLKNYCECYEAKIVCSANCKCIGCRNIDDPMDSNDRDNSQNDGNQSMKRTYDQREEIVKTEPAVPPKKPCNFITPDVIEATIQCIIAQADDCQKNNYDSRTSERKILEEFGRCLVEIIDFSKKNNENIDE